MKVVKAPNRRVRILFAVTLVLFAFQLAANYSTRSQPYPALAMPGFPGTPTADGEIDWNVPAVMVRLGDGRQVAVNFETVLPAETGVLPSAVFSSNFSDEGFVSDPLVVKWLHSRLQKLFPDDDVRSVEIVWQKAEYNLNAKPRSVPVLHTDKSINIEFDAVK